MARNPELDHEFNENREQPKPMIFTSGDMNFQPGGGAPKLTNGGFLGELMSNGNARTKLSTWQRVAVVLGVAVVASLIYTAIYFASDYYVLRSLFG